MLEFLKTAYDVTVGYLQSTVVLKYIVSFFISMVPIVELRGGVPAAIFLGIPEYAAIIVCTLGNMVPVPFIYFFARKVLNWGADKKLIGGFCRFVLSRGEKVSQKLASKGSKYGFFLALLLFVGIPLPGTGAWTGTLGASFLNAGFKNTVFSVTLGVLLAGIIMTIVSAVRYFF